MTYRVSSKSESSLNCVVVRFAMAPNNLSAVNTSLAVTLLFMLLTVFPLRMRVVSTAATVS